MAWDTYTLRVELEDMNNNMFVSNQTFKVGGEIDAARIEGNLESIEGDKMLMKIKCAFIGDTKEHPRNVFVKLSLKDR